MCEVYLVIVTCETKCVVSNLNESGDGELENQTWDENQGEDYGYQQFLEFERNLTRNACTEIKETIIEQNPSSHLIIQLENYMRSDMSIRVSVIDSLLRIYFEEAIVQANQEDKEIIEIIKKRLEPST